MSPIKALPVLLTLALCIAPGYALADDPEVEAEKTRMELERKQLEYDQKMDKERLEAEQKLRKERIEEDDEGSRRIIERSETIEVAPVAP
ncbi:MAG TPA: hypothetical protein VEC57_16670 [Candidatus Limnocylindrales bacterium]|nr:hypothetical protein [Candidatus Limnocylindrales bacterium]